MFNFFKDISNNNITLTKKFFFKKHNNDIYKKKFFVKEFFFENIYNNNIKYFITEWSIFYKNVNIYHFYKNTNTFSKLFLNLCFYLNTAKKQKLFNFKNNIKKNYFNIYWGFTSFWKALSFWFFSLFVGLGTVYILAVKRVCILPQTLFFWTGLFMLLYWLLSGFVFFIKKYQFSRYTSVIQRFWRRTYILFWLIESGLLLVFFYLTLNSTQESFYMFDQGYFLKTHLFSWKIFIFKSILVVALITYTYVLLLNLKWYTFNKSIIFLSIITVMLLYFVWLEFYQIYWVSNFYANFYWLYDFEESVWSLEWDSRRTRILNHYIMILFILKFWHIIFIFSCWVFFLLRSNELNIITYPLYSFNLQNFIILFIMTWLFMYPWLKHTFHWLYEIPYYWFYVDTHLSFYKIFVYDAMQSLSFILNNVFRLHTYNYFNIQNFIYWNFFDINLNTNTFIKNTIKDVVLKQLL